MKLKLLSLLIAMIAIVCLFASCKPKEQGGGGETVGEYYWGTDEINIALYEDDNKGELSSGLSRYYAGKTTSAPQDIDNLIKERNTEATSVTGVKANYTSVYNFGWGESFSDIQTKVSSGDSKAPDVYCNFAYDLTSLALRKCFANLYSNTVDYLQTYGKGQNYFTFTEEGYVGTGANYFDSAAGKGYFYDYMQSLSLANSKGQYDKMYCLASNYCVDLVRSFLVIPVNVQMMNSISLEDSTGDMTGDKAFDVEDFYKLVWANGWTYDVLAKYSNAVFVNNGKDATLAQIDDVLGAAFGCSSGLTPSGLLYTTSVKIIEKNTANGTTSYSYPTENTDLVNFASKLNSLFTNNKNNGICSVTRGEAQAVGGDNSEQGELVGIRKRFADNKILFGGIIAVGSLEDGVYQGMMDGSLGFGIVPVPVYREGDEYLTLVHNIARIVAISATTTQFEQCTAYLDYVSTNSADILNAYYEQELVSKVEGGLAGDQNKLMLTYIRNHVRDCFDKTYEDVISSYLKQTDSNADKIRWHQVLADNRYMFAGMDGHYKSYANTKNGHLQTILTAWDALSRPNK